MNNTLAIHMFHQQRYLDALLPFKEIIYCTSDTVEPDVRVEACYYTALCYKALHDWKNALDYLILSFQFGPPRAEICCELGSYYLECTNFTNAISWFELATKLSPRKNSTFYFSEYWGYIPHMQLCLCYSKQGNLVAASYHNEQAGTYQPLSPTYLENKKLLTSALIKQSMDKLQLQKDAALAQRTLLSSLPNEGVSLVLVTNKASFIDNIFDNYNSLLYDKRELILILNNNSLCIDDYLKKFANDPNTHIYQIDENMTLGECLNFAIQKASYSYVGKLDDDDYYGPNYLIDQMNLFKLQKTADVVVKSKRFIFFEKDASLRIFSGKGENQFVTGGGGGTIIAKRTVFDSISFRSLNVGEDEAFFRDCKRNAFKIYAGNKFNYVYKRYTSSNSNTYQIPINAFTSYSETVYTNEDYKSVSSV